MSHPGTVGAGGLYSSEPIKAKGSASVIVTVNRSPGVSGASSASLAIATGR